MPDSTNRPEYLNGVNLGGTKIQSGAFTRPLKLVGNVKLSTNPEIVVLSGGVINALENERIKIITKTAQNYAKAGTDDGLQCICSELGSDTGITSAAMRARKLLK